MPKAARRSPALARSMANTRAHGAVVLPITLPSVKPDGRVEVPRSADLDHVDLAGQCRRERLVVFVALHDAPYRFIDFRHATGENESHRLHRSVASNGHRHHGIDTKPLRHFA